jgi:CheY-like chemotaxis protein
LHSPNHSLAYEKITLNAGEATTVTGCSRSRSQCAVANELILVVEDHDKNHKLVRDVLAFKGYEIIEAETGEEGVRLAQERHPSLVLMDIRLPGINGIEALRRLRAEQATREIPIMAMIASVMTQSHIDQLGVRERRAAVRLGDP